MDILTTSLDALLQRATNPQNQNVDTAAVEAFYVLVSKEKEGCHIGVKLLATKIHSKQEKEVLQTLHILDTCMQKCGSCFQSEVGKFRFLNEMIKLVSPKYLGSQTPFSVRQKVLQLMYLWTLDYPKETKIKEAYDMLKKQGVIREVGPLSICSDNCPVPERKENSIFHDEEKSKLLQKLLQSKNPEDLQAANRLIKCMVKEDDKRAELKSRRILELESVHNNVRLLNEMLDSYRKGFSSQDEVELIKELYQSCERLRPNLLKLASESQQNEEMLNEVLQASDELGQVFEKYNKTILSEGTNESKDVKNELHSPSLLDFGTTRAESNALLDGVKVNNLTNSDNTQQSELDVLCDIFTSPNIPMTLSLHDEDILKPVTVLNEFEVCNKADDDKVNGKLKALEDLDALGEHLLKQNLHKSTRQGHQFQKMSDKIPMNLLPKQNESVLVEKTDNKTTSLSLGNALNFDLNYLLEKPVKQELKIMKTIDQNGGDDLLVDISDDLPDSNYKEEKVDDLNNTTEDKLGEEVNTKSIQKNKLDFKLSDLYVHLDSIKPSSIPPVKALEEKNGISVILHFAKDKPRDDVLVIVVTIVSKNESPLKNVLFRAIVPKTCKVKLQSASGNELPPFNPFLPPSAITQIMLIANPENVKVSLKFIVSYNIDDETTTEMGEIDCLPTVH